MGDTLTIPAIGSERFDSGRVYVRVLGYGGLKGDAVPRALFVESIDDGKPGEYGKGARYWIPFGCDSLPKDFPNECYMRAMEEQWVTP